LMAHEIARLAAAAFYSRQSRINTIPCRVRGAVAGLARRRR
jgi:hypothetical protein